MKVSELLQRRRTNWQELERLCAQLETTGGSPQAPEAYIRFASLYRATCADLALADSYQLPPNTVQYLHQLIGRAHNQLYRTHTVNLQAIARTLLHDVPRTIFSDRCVHVAMILFWGFFLIAAAVAAQPEVHPSYAEQLIGQEQIDQMKESFAQPPHNRPMAVNYFMAGFYIRHNTGIGLQCFATGLLIVPGIVTLIFNALVLGASFGYMARPGMEQGPNFFEFVTAHGPFELTAIALSAGAGLRLGVSILVTGGLTRIDSLRKAGLEALPVMGAAVVMFFMAALIEGFLSPSPAPYWVKAGTALLSSGLIMYYFVVLGFPREAPRAAR